MNLLQRIDMFLVVRRADRAIARAKAAKAERELLNRPHVPSVHVVGYFVPPPAPTARDYGITPAYVACLALLACAVFYLNQFHPEPAGLFACAPTQIASK